MFGHERAPRSEDFTKLERRDTNRQCLQGQEKKALNSCDGSLVVRWKRPPPHYPKGK